MQEDAEPKASRVIDKLLHAEMNRRGFLSVSVERTRAMSTPVSLEVQVNGQYRPTQLHNGQHYLEANEGEAYSLILRNPTYERKLVILTVDGLNTLNGKVGSFDGPGWIVPPRGFVRVDGWKVDSSTGAAFRFGTQESSYSVQIGKGAVNLGVIGAAVFDEQPKTVVYRHWASNDDGSTAKSYPPGPTTWSSSVVRGASSAARNSDVTKTSGGLGTQFGQSVSMPTKTVEFTRASEVPSALLTIRYATRAELTAWGIPVLSIQPSPQAFPGEGCPPPPGWNL